MLNIVAGFHVIAEDDWVLQKKLESLKFCSRVVVLIDAHPGMDETTTRYICSQYPNVEVHTHTNTLGLAAEGPDGPICEEGVMRQETWNLIAKSNPDWVILGDADEIMTPDIVDFFNNPPDVDLCYVHIVNLFKDSHTYICGKKCAWSYQCPGSNKKGALVRFNAKRHANGGYIYQLDRYRHTKIEPSPLDKSKVIIDSKHILIDTPKMIHWKWVNWPRWEMSKQSRMGKYKRLWQGIQLDTVPDNWHWK